jgi:hypothetical protein
MQGLKASTLRPQYPLWVISGHFAVQMGCPLSSKADICEAPAHVRFGPIADIVEGSF